MVREQRPLDGASGKGFGWRAFCLGGGGGVAQLGRARASHEVAGSSPAVSYPPFRMSVLASGNLAQAGPIEGMERHDPVAVKR